MRRLVGLVLSGGKDCRLWDVKASVTSKWGIAGWIEANERAGTRCIYSVFYVGWLVQYSSKQIEGKPRSPRRGEVYWWDLVHQGEFYGVVLR